METEKKEREKDGEAKGIEARGGQKLVSENSLSRCVELMVLLSKVWMYGEEGPFV